MDQETLLKELVKEIEKELDKEAQYSRIRDYYGSNPSIGLPSTYDTIFKDVDSVLKDSLAPIPLSLQRGQMKQALLYQGSLISINQINEINDKIDSIVERIYDRPQIKLRELLLGIDHKEIQEIWEVSYIVTSSTSKPHYVVILKDMTLLCMCMYIINQGMPCRHQYRILLQSNKAIFHMGLFMHVGLNQYQPKQIITLQLLKELKLIPPIHYNILIKCELLVFTHQILKKNSTKSSNMVLLCQ